MRTHNQETQATMTPKKALQYLHEGNDRFLSNLRASRDLLKQVNETRDGQFPFATVLSCIDSRTSAELIFDQGLGDIFSIRIAGNVLNDDILGSMEFTAKVAGVRAIVVLGHTRCGAIKGACDHVQLGNLSTLLNKIQPSAAHRPKRAEAEHRPSRTRRRGATGGHWRDLRCRVRTRQLAGRYTYLGRQRQDRPLPLGRYREASRAAVRRWSLSSSSLWLRGTVSLQEHDAQDAHQPEEPHDAIEDAFPAVGVV